MPGLFFATEARSAPIHRPGVFPADSFDALYSGPVFPFPRGYVKPSLLFVFFGPILWESWGPIQGF